MWIVYWAVLVIAAVVCGDFAVSNRVAVSLALWPLPFVIDLQLYLLIFAALLIGVFAGLILAWIAARHRRRELRRSRRKIATLERELEPTRLRRQTSAAGPVMPAHN